MSATDTCLFCRIARREIPASVMWEDEHCLAFRDIDPKSPTHFLVIPKRHFASLNDATDGALLGRLMLAAREIAEGEGIAQSGYRTIVNTGADAGQSVSHLHVHVMGGRHMAWPPG
jgi:histidine triad (HIT) family protein